MNECKICSSTVGDDRFNSEYGICYGCAMVLDSKVKSLQDGIQLYQDRANSADEPSEKIMYLKLMLDLLYEYKVQYYDNEVDVLQQNVEELIDAVIECISEAKL